MSIKMTVQEMQTNIRQWENFKLSHNEREIALIEAVPFWTVRDRKIHKVLTYEANLFWLDPVTNKDEDEGLAYFHFKGLDSMDSKPEDVLPVFTTEAQAKIGWQKLWKKFYDDNYKYYENVVKELDTFREENLEVFI